jgi:hypothetical protein
MGDVSPVLIMVCEVFRGVREFTPGDLANRCRSDRRICRPRGERGHEDQVETLSLILNPSVPQNVCIPGF